MKSSSFNFLHEKIQRWVWKQGWEGLHEIQEKSIPIILDSDKDVIISAGTAEGKTEAVFLPIFTYLLNSDTSNSYKVLYLSPLKALINDQYKRLWDLSSSTGINITRWHSDIPFVLKRKSILNANGILIITPESLESILVNNKTLVYNAFKNLDYIVIDELHCFIGTERGKQLQSLLVRIENIIGRKVPRIAMSATFSDLSEVSNFLRLDKSIPCVVLDSGNKKEIKLLVKDTSSYEDFETYICNDIFNLVRNSNNLIFANSRHMCEELGYMLSNICYERNVPNIFRVHHGNIGQEERESIEKEMKEGCINTICSSTLELGIDIGKIKSIFQIGTINSISSLRQRLGRSGRGKEPCMMRLYVEKDSDNLISGLYLNLVQNIAAIELLLEHKYDDIPKEIFHFSTLIQQILSILSSYTTFYPKEGWLMLCKKGAFPNVTVNLYLQLLKSLGQHNVIQQMTNGQIVLGPIGEKLVNKRDFYVAFKTDILYNILDIESGKVIGCIENLPSINDSLYLGGRKWKVLMVDKKSRTINVELNNQKADMFFSVNDIPVSNKIALKMKDIYASNKQYAYLDKRTFTNDKLEIARKIFNVLQIGGNPFVLFGEKNFWFTWAGNKINFSICSIINYFLPHNNSVYNLIYIANIGLDDIKEISSKTKPNAQQLLKVIKREDKEEEKYDYLLSDYLLDREFESKYLDIDNAWNLIKEVTLYYKN